VLGRGPASAPALVELVKVRTPLRHIHLQNSQERRSGIRAPRIKQGVQDLPQQSLAILGRMPKRCERGLGAGSKPTDLGPDRPARSKPEGAGAVFGTSGPLWQVIAK